MTKEELLKEIMKLPKVETNNPISTMTSINVDDLMSAVDRLNKVPDYNDLVKENQELKKENEQLQKELEEYKNPIKYFKYASKNVTDENKKLKDNWNKLKEYIKTEIPEDVFIDTEWFVAILDKMAELGQGSDSNEI